MIKRELYLKRLRDSYNSNLIKIITGVRRCGKSILLTQIMDELKEKGVDLEHIIYINFEDYDYVDFTLDPKKFNSYIKEKIKDDKKYYLFFDEIQNVKDFERVVNSFRAILNVSIFLTGSNSKLLSSELSTHLTGRYISIKMMPFTYSEFVELKKLQNEEVSDESFYEYLEWGGMPQIYNTDSEIEKKLYLKDIFNTVILKDIVEKNSIKDINLLNRIIQFIMENIGGIISSNFIAKYLKKENINTSVDTVLNYMEYIRASMIISKVNRYDIRGKNVMATLEKYYVSDLGLLQLKKTPIEQKVGGRLENIVYNELIARGYDVYIGKTDNGEIDFVVEGFKEKFYIQVANILSDDEVVKREFGAYDNVNDNYPKYVLTMDKIDYSRNGIIHKNIIEWLYIKIL